MAAVLEQLIERVTRLRAKRTRAAVESFADLVQLVAAGQPPDEESLDTILESCGKSLDDLRKAVALAGERERLRSLIAERPARQKRYQKAEAAQTAIEQERLEILADLHTRACQAAEELEAALWDRHGKGRR